MEVLNTSPSFFPTLTGQITLTNSPNTLPAAPPSRLAPAGGISPSGRIPLGQGERGNYSQETDNQTTLSASGGDIHSAPIGTRPFYSLSQDFRGTVGPTQPYLAPSVLEGRSLRPITTTLVTYATGSCNHVLSPAHRGWIPAQSLTSAHTFSRATRRGRGSLNTYPSPHRRDNAQPPHAPGEGAEPPTQKLRLGPSRSSLRPYNQ